MSGHGWKKERSRQSRRSLQGALYRLEEQEHAPQRRERAHRSMAVKVTRASRRISYLLPPSSLAGPKKNTVASRREAAAILRKGIVDANGVEALDKLFKEIGPKFKDRNGGYTTGLQARRSQGRQCRSRTR
jgi:hypothetical protein